MGDFPGGSHGFVIGHVTPEAFTGGPIAIIKNGDPIEIDGEKKGDYAQDFEDRASEAPWRMETAKAAVR